MNVLFLTCWYPDSENPAAGTFIKEHARAINDQPDIHVKVLQIWPRKGSGFYRKVINVFIDGNGIETHQVFIFSFAYKLIYLLNWLLNSLAYDYVNKHILPDWKPDLVHGNVVFQAGVMGNFLAQKLNIPFFLSEHWSGLDWYLKTPYVSSKAGVQAYRSAKTVFPVSRNLKESIQDKIGGDLHMRIVPNAVDTDRFRYAGDPENTDVVKILCVTNFKTGRAIFKLPGLILDALGLMDVEERARLRIDFVGGGDGLEDFQSVIRNLGFTDTVICLGFRQKEEISRLMQTADALVHPSVAETFGVVVAEALCCGLPCAVSNVPALDELVDSFNGVLVDKNTPEEWKEALFHLSSQSKNYNRKLIAQKAGERFNYREIGKMIVEKYKEELS